jgi:CxxC motif-containing protein (DUF1111 family)
MLLSTNVVVTTLLTAGIASGQAHDPGLRGGPAAAGGALAGLAAAESAAFVSGLATFQEIDDVSHGLGPRFNMDSCAGCHAFPAVGGSSPALNPQVAVATTLGATNTLPPFITASGPVREVRFKLNRDGTRDGGVHDLFTIRGRADAPGCMIAQPDFSNTANLSFRIPTPTFGAGLIEAIADSTLKDNLRTNAGMKSRMGISGHLNTSGNDGTVTRFGWKAQNKSLLMFAGEAYNVEQGVSNTLFVTDREEDPGCATNRTPEDGFPLGGLTDILQFANFMRFLEQPKSTATAANGRALFTSVGCALCHTPALTTGNSVIAALRNQQANLFSDLALHHMGSGLADNIQQGSAAGDEFRTAPLWGLGQRIFFLHDGRTTDLLAAIRQHTSNGSEANQVIAAFNALSGEDQQQLLEFLRSL